MIRVIGAITGIFSIKVIPPPWDDWVLIALLILLAMPPATKLTRRWKERVAAKKAAIESARQRSALRPVVTDARAALRLAFSTTGYVWDTGSELHGGIPRLANIEAADARSKMKLSAQHVLQVPGLDSGTDPVALGNTLQSYAEELMEFARLAIEQIPEGMGTPARRPHAEKYSMAVNRFHDEWTSITRRAREAAPGLSVFKELSEHLRVAPSAMRP